MQAGIWVESHTVTHDFQLQYLDFVLMPLIKRQNLNVIHYQILETVYKCNYSIFSFASVHLII